MPILNYATAGQERAWLMEFLKRRLQQRAIRWRNSCIFHRRELRTKEMNALVCYHFRQKKSAGMPVRAYLEKNKRKNQLALIIAVFPLRCFRGTGFYNFFFHIPPTIGFRMETNYQSRSLCDIQRYFYFNSEWMLHWKLTISKALLKPLFLFFWK